jgi:hypothetical protein
MLQVVNTKENSTHRIWRLIVPIAIGLVAWWGLGNLLSPKPLYSLRFPHNDWLQRPDKPWDGFFFLAQPIDRGEKFLLIQRPGVPSAQSLMTEIRDLRTGQLIVSHHESVEERLGSVVDYSPWYPNYQPDPLADGEGNIFLVPGARTNHKENEFKLCRWNLLNNTRQLVELPSNNLKRTKQSLSSLTFPTSTTTSRRMLQATTTGGTVILKPRTMTEPLRITVKASGARRKTFKRIPIAAAPITTKKTMIGQSRISMWP